MKKLFSLHVLICIILMATVQTSFSQEAVNDYKPFDANLTIKNIYLWRGFRVNNSPMVAADLYYISKDKSFKAGLWGGCGFTGEYKEFDYFVSYTKKGFTLAVWDINNFTGREGAKIFDYKAATTSHFIDVTASYQFQGKVPLKFSWSTIVAGRDFYLDANGNAKNRFSNYVQVDCPVYTKNDLTLGLYLGGAFAFGREDHFYGNHPNIVNAGVSLSKTVSVLGLKFPVSATGMWNPEQNYGGLQLAVQLL